MKEFLQDIYEKLDRKLEAECIRVKDKIPYTTQDGMYRTDMREENLFWWTNGFWAGMLWQMYHATGKEIYRKTAEYSEEALDRALDRFEGLHHDVGFQFLHTAVADWRLTKNPRSRIRGLQAATLLAGRFNGNGNFIRAWNMDRRGWMIIDTMMNLPLLYWASEETKDPRFSWIAGKHADTAGRLLMRGDGSCNHIAIRRRGNFWVILPDRDMLPVPLGPGGRPGRYTVSRWLTCTAKKRSIWIWLNRQLITLLPM